MNNAEQRPDRARRRPRSRRARKPVGVVGERDREQQPAELRERDEREEALVGEVERRRGCRGRGCRTRSGRAGSTQLRPTSTISGKSASPPLISSKNRRGGRGMWIGKPRTVNQTVGGLRGRSWPRSDHVLPADRPRHSWISDLGLRSPCSAASAIAPWRSATGISARPACRRGGSARGCPCGARTSAARRRGRRRTSRRDRRAPASAPAAGRRRSRGTRTPGGRKYCTPYTKTRRAPRRRDRPEAAHHDHREDPQARVGGERLTHEELLLEHEQRARHSREEARDREREHQRVAGPNGVRLDRGASLSRTPMSTRPVRLAAQAAHRPHARPRAPTTVRK